MATEFKNVKLWEHEIGNPLNQSKSLFFFPFRHAPSEIKGCYWNVRPKDEKREPNHTCDFAHTPQGENRGEASSSCPQRGPISRLDTSNGGIPPAEPRKLPRPPKPHVRARPPKSGSRRAGSAKATYRQHTLCAVSRVLRLGRCGRPPDEPTGTS